MVDEDFTNSDEGQNGKFGLSKFSLGAHGTEKHERLKHER